MCLYTTSYHFLALNLILGLLQKPWRLIWLSDEDLSLFFVLIRKAGSFFSLLTFLPYRLQLWLPLSRPNKLTVILLQLSSGADDAVWRPTHLIIFLRNSSLLHELPYKVIRDAYSETPRWSLLNIKRLAATSCLLQQGVSWLGEGGYGDERQNWVEQVSWEKKIFLAELKLVVLRKRRYFLTNVKRTRPTHHVFWKLHHQLRDVNRTVVDVNHTVGFYELDCRRRWRSRKLEARVLTSYQVETPWDDLQSVQHFYHTHIYS